MSDNGKNENLKLLFDITDKNIQYCKQQQWKVSVYVLTLYAAIFTFFGRIKSCIFELKYLLSMAICLISISGTIILINLQFNLKKYRDRENDVANDLGLSKYLSKKEEISSISYHWEIFFSLLLTYWIGSSILIYYFLSHWCYILVHILIGILICFVYLICKSHKN